MLFEKAFRIISEEDCVAELRHMQAFLSDKEKKGNSLKMVYEELGIIDSKLVQLLAFDGGLLVANGVLFRGVIDVMLSDQFTSPLQSVVIWILIISFALSICSALWSAIPGIVWGPTSAVSLKKLMKKKLLSEADDEEIRTATLKQLIRVKLIRTRRYYRSALLSAGSALAMIAGLTILGVIL